MILCEWIFKGSKTRRICTEVMRDLVEKGYHEVVDSPLYRYVYTILKKYKIVQKITVLKGSEIDKMKRRRVLVANKAHLWSLIKNLLEIADRPTPRIIK